ncbi:type VII secretion-associated serine protease mycosin [Micromonospora sp. WMMD1120]|uniref:type VII secretion-associated serine protease mycosin n=1 Tax=Micromonospora sp. WMMD1120 TaxID=3016106 RepID=UPI0024172A58|nr:type VII secretion-associated serine protease mycosin [Micromonospora sp. WMMD1120]MDG4807870.1 type VII secretion-associated serine protease mycosin [Micromonospora sp. WMMD1120]
MNGPFDHKRDEQWHLSVLTAAKAHQLSQGDGIVIALPDTGVDQHPDLRGNILPGKDIIAGGGGDGLTDKDGHGTGMAGLIAAHGTGGTGAVGIAPRAKILPIFCSPPNTEGDTESLAAAIEYAISRRVDVISVSIAGGASSRLHQAVRMATQANITIVAGVGNFPATEQVGYPARYPEVIAVGGIDRDGNRADISVTGPEVDVVAPAVDIYSTSIGGKYRKGTGTSDATAIVAGAAALIRSKYPHLPAREVAHRLTATAIDKGPPGRDNEYGYGVIDLVAALTADVPPLGFESVSAPASGGVTGGVDAQPDDDGDAAATSRGLATLGVIVAAGAVWAWMVRRRRRGDDPPPRISR